MAKQIQGAVTEHKVRFPCRHGRHPSFIDHCLDGKDFMKRPKRQRKKSNENIQAVLGPLQSTMKTNAHQKKTSEKTSPLHPSGEKGFQRASCDEVCHVCLCVNPSERLLSCPLDWDSVGSGASGWEVDRGKSRKVARATWVLLAIARMNQPRNQCRALV